MKKEKFVQKFVQLVMVLYITAILITVLCVNPAWAQKQATSSTPQYGGILKIISQPKDILELGYPVDLRLPQEVLHALPALETLFSKDKNNLPIPGALATGFKIAKDSKSITITLRKGVKFHDGTDFDAEAVKFNLDTYRTSPKPELKAVESIDILDNFTVRLNLSRFDSALTDVLASIQGLMISPTAVKKYGREWCDKHPVGTGPFEFVSWELDVSLKYKKFDGYWQKGKPYLDAIEFVFVADPMVAKASLQSGEAQAMRVMSARDAYELQRTGELNLVSCPLCVHLLIGDSKHPQSPFADIRVRRAVEHAIDKQALVKALGYGTMQVTNQLVPQKHWTYNPAVVGYPYDPKKAKQLLSEAGYPNGFKTKIRLSVENRNLVEMSTAAQAYFAKVGIEAQVDAMGFGPLSQYNEKGWENSMVIAQIGLQNDIATSVERSISATGRRAHSLIAPADYDEKLRQALQEPDLTTKKEYMQEYIKLGIDKYAQVLPFFVDYARIVESKKLHGTGIYEINGEVWTPADAWLAK